MEFEYVEHDQVLENDPKIAEVEADILRTKAALARMNPDEDDKDFLFFN